MTDEDLPAPGARDASLVDRLESDLLNLKSVVKILEAVGIDPAGPDAKQIVAHMVAGMYHGIQRKPERVPRYKKLNATKWTKWTILHDAKLKFDIEWCQREHGVSERDAVSLIAETSRRRQNASPTRQINARHRRPAF